MDNHVSSSSFLTVNPFISIWNKPRSTLHEIIRFNPEYLVFPIAVISAITTTIALSVVYLASGFNSINLGIFTFILNSLNYFIFMYYVSPFFLSKVSGLFNGKGNFIHSRTVVVWSEIAGIPASILISIGFYLQLTSSSAIQSGGFLMLGFIASIYSLGILIAGFREINDYSLNKSILVIVIAHIPVSILTVLLEWGFSPYLL
jgi:hypothetical protein